MCVPKVHLGCCFRYLYLPEAPISGCLSRWLSVVLALDLERIRRECIHLCACVLLLRPLTFYSLTFYYTSLGEDSKMATSSLTPASPPPPGVTSNFENPESLVRVNYIAMGVAIPLTTVFFTLRAYTRIWIKQTWIFEDCKSYQSNI